MIRLRQVKVKINNNNLEDKIINKLHIKRKDLINYKIVKKSIDARDKNNILYVYEIDVNVRNESNILLSSDITKINEVKYNPIINNKVVSSKRPIIIGSGPCGLYAALILALNGLKPIVIERGEKIEDRVITVEDFFKTNKLNKNSNVQFGEGGAGTFSDGKLSTGVKDKLGRINFILETFVECGAPKDILYDAHPHIGTDILRNVIINLREEIITLGGEFRYNTTLTDIIIDNNKLKHIVLNNKEKVDVDTLVLAIGHSARDTFKMLYDKGLSMRSKPFAVGLRIEHPRTMIDKDQYGKYSEVLPSASYKLTYRTKEGRGVYSFCMCPGGYVVNASSEEGCLAVNGMSNYKRDARNSNSAIVVTVSSKDYGSGVLDGVEFQRKLEEKAYREGNGLIPVQKYIDFKSNLKTTYLGSVTPCTKGGYTLSNLNNVLPNFIVKSIIEAMPNFARKIKDFDMNDAILLGVESRTSSPVVIERGEDFQNLEGIYPAGEGAGYAGGIMTSALDGIKIAEEITKKYVNEAMK